MRDVRWEMGDGRFKAKAASMATELLRQVMRRREANSGRRVWNEDYECFVALNRTHSSLTAIGSKSNS